MADQTVVAQVLLVNESYEPLTNVEVWCYDISTGAKLDTQNTNNLGIASFGTDPLSPLTFDAAIQYWFKPYVTRKQNEGRVYLSIVPAPPVAAPLETATGSGTASLSWGSE